MDAGGRAALQRDLTALARGERSAFEVVFVRLWPVVRGFAGGFLPPHEAEDAAQEALLKIFGRANAFDPRRDALSWALGVAAWQIRTHRTRARRRREESLEAAPEPPDRAVSPEEKAIAGERAAALERALSQLSASDAATLAAYARGDRPDLPDATFRKRVSRALSRLRARWRIPHGSL